VPAKPISREQPAASPPDRELALASARPAAPPPDPFAPDATPKPLYLPMLTPSGDHFALDTFDAPADTAARLSRDDFAAFQTHLQKCWNPPASVASAQKLSAVLRIALTRDGAMMAEPILVKASASAQGPALVQSAAQALIQCQPFRFLPVDKYEEWKVLELSFSSQAAEHSGSLRPPVLIAQTYCTQGRGRSTRNQPLPGGGHIILNRRQSNRATT
jgi:hypothetical protein